MAGILKIDDGLFGRNDLPRVDDFEYEGKKASEKEKTEAQRKVVELAKQFVSERLEKLGLKGRTIEERRVLFHIIEAGLPRYESGIDFVLLPEFCEADVGTNIHELLHYSSSEWRYIKPEEVENKRKKRNVKSGFHTVWGEKGGAGANFWALNEATTEKIACEIFLEHQDEIRKLKELFPGKLEEKLAQLEARFEKRKRKSQEKIVKIRSECQAEIERVTKKHEMDMKQHEEEFSVSQDISEEDIESFKQMMRQSIANRIELIRSMYETQENMELSWQSDKQKNSESNEIRHHYSFSAERDSYIDQIKILELLLDGVAYSISSSREEFDKKRAGIWEDMQRAYFTGNVMWLRKFERVFGKGTLRKINRVGLMNPELAKEIIETLDRTIQAFKRFQN